MVLAVGNGEAEPTKDDTVGEETLKRGWRGSGNLLAERVELPP